MNVVAVIQARMGSTRLPGKVLMDLAGKPVLRWVVERIGATPGVDRVVVATSSLAHDQPIADCCAAMGVPCVRGSEADVLDRFRAAAERFEAQGVVRITGDCPLIDPQVSGRVVALLREGQHAYVSNVRPRLYPRGLDTEAFTADALLAAAAEADQPHHREHVTPFLVEQPQRFPPGSVTPDADYSAHRWTLDTPEDFALLEALCARLPADFGWRDVLSVVEADPALRAMNQHIEQKPTK